MCALASSRIASPGRVSERIANWLPIVPDGTNTAASLPSNAAVRCSSSCTVGSSPSTSSPTIALAMTSRIAASGWVIVSLRRSILPLSMGGRAWRIRQAKASLFCAADRQSSRLLFPLREGARQSVFRLIPGPVESAAFSTGQAARKGLRRAAAVLGSAAAK